MTNLVKVLKFGLPYLRRYWVRLAAGVLLGILFGVFNASFVWATKTLIGRMAPKPVAVMEANSETAATNVAPLPPSRSEQLKARAEELTEKVVDPWLPRVDRPVDRRQIIGGILFMSLLAGFRGYIGFLSSYCLAWASERMTNDLRVDVLQKLSGLSFDFFNRSTMGDLTTRVNGDTVALRHAMTAGLSTLVKEPITIVSIFAALCLIDWKLTLGAMIFFPVCILPIAVLGRRVRKAARAGLKTGVTQSSLLFEMLSGIRVVKAFGLEAQQVDRFRELSKNIVRHAMRATRAKELVNPIIETVAMLGLGMIIVYIAAEKRSIEDLAGFLTGMIFIYTPFKKLAGLHVMFEQTRPGVDRLAEILREEPTVKEPARAVPLPAFSSAITFNQVSFSYGGELVLKDINLTLPRGFKLGIAGESGCGKSTLVNLFFRFYDPTAGAIKIDGHDLREVSIRDLRHLMALVSQEIVLFDWSVAENIACGKSGATAEEIEAAARAAYAHEFITALPEGYQTRIGERGVNLSGGQRQRLAIARAFVRNAPILVLDEATAALDSQAEAEVQMAIERLEENRTVLCVAHRLSTLANMDQIIVMKQGRIIEQDTYDHLLRAGGAFATMARRQGISWREPVMASS